MVIHHWRTEQYLTPGQQRDPSTPIPEIKKNLLPIPNPIHDVPALAQGGIDPSPLQKEELGRARRLSSHLEEAEETLLGLPSVPSTAAERRTDPLLG
jgi:hypothetical protein